MAKRLDVPLAQLREPADPMRRSMAAGGLDDLVSSIRAVGILQPLLVRELADGSFEVVAGHRRLLAARAAGLERVPVMVHRDQATATAAKVHENVVREDVSPADEADYFAEIYHANGDDVDRLAEIVRRPRDYVERRLLLHTGDPQVLDALRAGTVVIGVAEELNRMKRPEDRAYYLEYAVRAGASVRQMREWRGQANVRAELALAAPPVPAAAEGAGAGAAAAPSGPSYTSMAKPHEFSAATETRRCLFCDVARPEWQMFVKHVCQPCADQHLVPLEQKREGGPHGR